MASRFFDVHLALGFGQSFSEGQESASREPEERDSERSVGLDGRRRQGVAGELPSVPQQLVHTRKVYPDITS